MKRIFTYIIVFAASLLLISCVAHTPQHVRNTHYTGKKSKYKTTLGVNKNIFDNQPKAYKYKMR